MKFFLFFYSMRYEKLSQTVPGDTNAGVRST